MPFGLSAIGINLGSPNNLSRTATSLNRALSRLSSGLRINNASDDPAGLALAANLDATIAQMSQASRNVSDAGSALSIADGALGQVSDITIRMQELATMAANGTYSDQQRSALQAEYTALSQEIQRIGQTTTFNGKNLLDGSTMSVQIGSGGDSLQVGGINLAELSSAATSQDISTQAGAQAAMSTVGQFSQDLISQRTQFIGAPMSRLDSMQNTLSTQTLAQTASLSQIRDADLSSAVVEATAAKALLQYQVSMIQQITPLTAGKALSLIG
ncbi:MAG: hypothetical protein RL518_1638 [Pseudomonadota bacterium]|jgi:flagellin